MRLKKLSLINFKNLAQQEIEFAPSINCFVGDNGTCKTNIVDAIHYLAMCKSALGMSDPQCVLHGEDLKMRWAVRSRLSAHIVVVIRRL